VAFLIKHYVELQELRSMSASGLLAQLLNGLASASSLFLVSVGLSLIFGVTRTINFAHGSFYMLGAFIAYSSVDLLSPHIGFWPALLLAPLACGAGCADRDAAAAPHLQGARAVPAAGHVCAGAGHQGCALWLWGPEELFGPRAAGLEGSVEILGRQFPTYDLFWLSALRPLGLTLLLTKPALAPWCARPQDREMVGALGVNQAWLFTAVFALGTLLAGLGGALQLPREPASLEMDMLTIGAAFVVVVVGGMGSIRRLRGALLVAELKAVCIWLGVQEIAGLEMSFSKLTLVVEFLVMAVVLIWRPGACWASPRRWHAALASPNSRCAAGRGATAAAGPAGHAGAAAAGRGAEAAAMPPCCWPISLSPRCLPPACISSSAPAACTPSVMRPTLASVPTVRPAGAYAGSAHGSRAAARPLAAAAAPCSMAGSACGCRASI
jgi:branched-chain amino acid transport system permease protein